MNQKIKIKMTNTSLFESASMPLVGIAYFISNPLLWAHFLSILIPQLVLTIVVGVVMFSTISMVLSIIGLATTGPIGFVIAWLNFFHQVDIISQFLGEKLLFVMPLQYVFDITLSRVGFDEVVVRGKLFRVVAVPWMISVKRWIFDLPENMIFYPMNLLNILINIFLLFIPIGGPILSVFINAPNKGFALHQRYYQLKGIDTRQRNAFYASRRFEYISLGIVANTLELIPFFSIFFKFCTASGAALWAAKFEAQFELQRNGEYPYMYNQRRGAFVMGPP